MAPPDVAPSAPAGDASGAPPPSRRPRRRRWWRWPVGLSAALLVYAALGFFLAPRLLRSAVQDRGTAALHRQVTVAKVVVNPFTLGITIDGLQVKDLDAPRLAGWESLYVRLAPWKVLRGDHGVAEIRLTRPFGRVALDAAGRLNVQDLLSGDQAAASPAPSPSRLGVALDRLEIEEARREEEPGRRVDGEPDRGAGEPAAETARLRAGRVGRSGRGCCGRGRG